MKRIVLFLFFVLPHLDSSAHEQIPLTLKEKNKKEVAYSEPEPDKKKLVERLYQRTLVALTDNKNAGIRCSAFFTLVKVNNEKVKEIFLHHIDDDEKFFLGAVWSYLAEFEQVNQFMLELLHPANSKSSYKLTNQEYDRYRKLIYR